MHVCRLTLTAAALVVAAVSTSACDSQQPTDRVAASGSSASQQQRSAHQVTPLVLPVDAYRLTAAQSDEIDQATRLLMTRCMKRFGFDYTPPRTANVLPSELAGNARRYGLADADLARDQGYQVGTGPGEISTTPEKLNSDEILALTGHLDSLSRPTKTDDQIPLGGCAGEAGRAISGDTESEFLAITSQDPVTKIDINSFDQSSGDPKVKNVIAAWSACMKSQGFDYAGPLDPARDPLVTNETTASPKELALATADVDCKQKTQLVQVWLSVETGIEKKLIQSSLTELAAVRSANAAQLKRAAAVLTGRPAN